MTNLATGHKAYKELKNDLAQIIQQGRSQLQQLAKEIAVATHWNVGKRLSESLSGSLATPEGTRSTETMARLAADLKIDKTVL